MPIGLSKRGRFGFFPGAHTTDLRPGETLSKPIRPSSRMILVAVLWLTLLLGASVLALGKRSPGFISPERIFFLYSSNNIVRFVRRCLGIFYNSALFFFLFQYYIAYPVTLQILFYIFMLSLKQRPCNRISGRGYLMDNKKTDCCHEQVRERISSVFAFLNI